MIHRYIVGTALTAVVMPRLRLGVTAAAACPRAPSISDRVRSTASSHSCT
jgi:hypothetical protein